MKNKFLKTLLMFFVPTVIPLLILGTLSLALSNAYLISSLDESTEDLLNNQKTSIEHILEKADELHIAMAASPNISLRVDEFLSNDIDSYIKLEAYEIVKEFLNSAVAATDYIESIYLYKGDSFPFVFNTMEGLVHMYDMVDLSWMYTLDDTEFYKGFYSELRYKKNYVFQTNETAVISIFKLMDSMQQSTDNGYIIINIKQDYVNDLLSGFNDSDARKVCVFNQDNVIIAQSNNLSDVELTEIQNKFNGSEDNIVVDGKEYTSHVTSSSQYQWTYLALTPTSMWYEWPNIIIYITIALLLVSFLFSVFLSFLLSNRSQKQIRNIENLFDYVKKYKKLPPIKKSNDQYEEIIENIISIFVSQQYLTSEIERKKYEAKTMELLALRNQINPHFIFNTLESIKWQSIELTKKPNQVTSMIENLSEILYFSLRSTDDLITVDDEIYYAKVYLSIMSIRYPNKFDARFICDENVLNTNTIRIILQPFLENSIYHGIKAKESKSKIRVTIKNKEDKIMIRITDTGLGMDKETLAKLMDSLNNDVVSESHIGVCNVYRRLMLYYSENIGFKIFSRKNIGTVVEISLPSGLSE